jgi:hypothetical protein
MPSVHTLTDANPEIATRRDLLATTMGDRLRTH